MFFIGGGGRFGIVVGYQHWMTGFDGTLRNDVCGDGAAGISVEKSDNS